MTVYEEAVIEAQKLKELAEKEAKKAVLEAITPHIRKILYKEISGREKFDDILLEQDEQNMALPPLPQQQPQQMPQVQASQAPEDELPIKASGEDQDSLNVSLPDAEGKMVVDFEDLFSPDMGEEEQQETAEENLLNQPQAAAPQISTPSPGPKAIPQTPPAPQQPLPQQPQQPLMENKQFATFHNDLYMLGVQIGKLYSNKNNSLKLVKETKNNLFNTYEKFLELIKENVIPQDAIAEFEKRFNFLFEKMKEISKKNNNYINDKGNNKMSKLSHLAERLTEESEKTDKLWSQVEDVDMEKREKERESRSKEWEKHIDKLIERFASENDSVTEEELLEALHDEDEEDLEECNREEEELDECACEEKEEMMAEMHEEDDDMEKLEKELRNSLKASSKSMPDVSDEDIEDAVAMEDEDEDDEEEFDIEDEDSDEDEDMDLDLDSEEEEEEEDGDEDEDEEESEDEDEEEFEDEDEEEFDVEDDKEEDSEDEEDEEESGEDMKKAKAKAMLEWYKKLAAPRSRKKLHAMQRRVKKLQKQLHEMQLWNAKVMFLNKFLVRNDLSKETKRGIAEYLDRAKSIPQLRTYYRKINALLEKTARKRTNKVVGSSSRATSTSRTQLTENVIPASERNRLMELAGLIKNDE